MFASFKHHFSPPPSVHSIQVSHVDDRISVAFFAVFQWQNNFPKEFSFRLINGLILSSSGFLHIECRIFEWGKDRNIASKSFPSIKNLKTCVFGIKQNKMLSGLMNFCSDEELTLETSVIHQTSRAKSKCDMPYQPSLIRKTHVKS